MRIKIDMEINWRNITWWIKKQLSNLWFYLTFGPRRRDKILSSIFADVEDYIKTTTPYEREWDRQMRMQAHLKCREIT